MQQYLVKSQNAIILLIEMNKGGSGFVVPLNNILKFASIDWENLRRRVNITEIYVHLIVHRHKILYNKTNRCTNFLKLFRLKMKLYMYPAVLPPIISSHSLYTPHLYMSYRFEDRFRANVTIKLLQFKEVRMGNSVSYKITALWNWIFTYIQKLRLNQGPFIHRLKGSCLV
jgi:hypothetical protein